MVNKHVFLFLTNAQGDKMDAAKFSIQDLWLKKDGHYDITCKAAVNDGIAINTIRHGRYSLKENKKGKITLLCDEETGQFQGHYELSFDLLKNDLGQFCSKDLKNGDAANGLFKISA